MPKSGTRILIFGNSGSGKSTIARNLEKEEGLTHLDLDNLAWLAEIPPKRRPLEQSAADITSFVEAHQNWVIEGCYADLLDLVIPHCSEVIFLNPGIEKCIARCRAREWEPHKYPSKAAQDANLSMLIEWVREYQTRDDEFSLKAHRKLYDSFQGKKWESRD